MVLAVYISVRRTVGAETLAWECGYADVARHARCMQIVLGDDGIVEVSAEEVVDVGWCLSVRMLVYLFLASIEHQKLFLDVLRRYASALYCYISCVLRRCWSE